MKPTLRLGSVGSFVREWQQFLHIKDDGIFGPLTKGATVRFQRMNDLEGDGIVGPLTWLKAGFGPYIGYGIDVSHHQNPIQVENLLATNQVDFCICRAAYGYFPDRYVRDHVNSARKHNVKVGLYTFYRSIESVDDQFDTLIDIAQELRFSEFDICPAIDIERDSNPEPGHDVIPKWSDHCEKFASLINRHFGNCLIYLTKREWEMMGSPEWVTQYPLWTAHYTHEDKPASLSEPTIWQHRVGPFERFGSGGVFRPSLWDQNRLLKPLPLITKEVVL